MQLFLLRSIGLESSIRTSVLLCLCFFLVAPSWAQTSQLVGRVMDQTEKQPIEYATVALFRSQDSSMVSGTVTSGEGRFKLEKLPAGSYYLVVQFMGFLPTKADNIHLSRNQQQDVGTLFLSASQVLLNELKVSGQKATVYHQVDKQVYNAAQFQTAAGGTGIDVLRNMPSVTVDAQGQISLRGTTGFVVYLNGKPIQSDAAQVLGQIPANAIENIEVITSPSAKYDPDGKAGIINITTKAGAANGLTLLVNGQVGLPSVQDYNNAEKPQRYGADATLSFRSRKWDVSLGGSYLRGDVAGRRVGDVNTTIGTRYTHFPSVGERSFDKYNGALRSAVTYTLSPTHTFQAGIYHSIRTEYRLADIFYTNRTTDLATGQLISRSNYFNSNLVKRHGSFTIANLDYIHTFHNQSTLTASTLYERDDLSGFTRNRNLPAPGSEVLLQYTETTTDRPLSGYRFKLDYATKLRGGKLEAGYQYRYHSDNGYFQYRERNLDDTGFTPYPEFSGNVDLENQIQSIYTQYGKKKEKLTYAAGLRYESSTRHLTIRQEEPLLLRLSNLFPSAQVLYELNDHWQLKAGYSRRIQRTNNFELNPLPEREHSETLEQGDPNLLPEFINLQEVGVIHPFKQGSLFLTYYHQGIKNPINRVNQVYADTILSRIYTNAGQARRIGMEAGLDVQATPWWKLYVGSNVYDYTIRGSLFNNQVQVNNGSLVYSLNLNQTFKLSPTLTLQSGLNYLSARATAQGEDSRFYSPNLSLKKQFMNGRLAATFQWQHMDLGLLNANEQRITTRGRDFYTTTNYIYEVDVLMLNLSYNLNPLNKKVRFTESEFGEKEF
ncbi:outer membrane beta-barrel family protein [Telluribacter sp. SYSU D00476]|uniref:outer membrane beta-barrel family protein n=1 Tax=Telluribacter sp. SYSU D00476 TaxID=2811430 RepID=UPI0021D3F22A|nr:outer membrane beta-barrel family protein [Telluribacter sp. SYSU D00476]